MKSDVRSSLPVEKGKTTDNLMSLSRYRFLSYLSSQWDGYNITNEYINLFRWANNILNFHYFLKASEQSGIKSSYSQLDDSI